MTEGFIACTGPHSHLIMPDLDLYIRKDLWDSKNEKGPNICVFKVYSMNDIVRSVFGMNKTVSFASSMNGTGRFVSDISCIEKSVSSLNAIVVCLRAE